LIAKLDFEGAEMGDIKKENIRCGNCIWWRVQYRYADKRPPPLDIGECKYMPLGIDKDKNDSCSQWNARPPHQKFCKMLYAIAAELRKQNDDDDGESKPENSITFVNVKGMPFL